MSAVHSVVTDFLGLSSRILLPTDLSGWNAVPHEDDPANPEDKNWADWTRSGRAIAWTCGA
jgi:hypothetical protein